MTQDQQEVLNEEFLGKDLSNATDQEVLEEAIKKAQSNGWDGMWYGVLKIEDTAPSSTEYYQVIFNHDFAKALWGEEPVILEYSHTTKGAIGSRMAPYEIFLWQYHIQKLAFAGDRMEYLRNNL